MVCGAHPDIGAPRMFKFTGSQLREIGSGDEGEDDIARKSLFQMSLYPEGVGGIHNNAGVFWSNYGFDDTGEIVDIGQRFDTQDDIVKGNLSCTSFIGRLNHWTDVSNTSLERKIGPV